VQATAQRSVANSTGGADYDHGSRLEDYARMARDGVAKNERAGVFEHPRPQKDTHTMNTQHVTSRLHTEQDHKAAQLVFIRLIDAANEIVDSVGPNLEIEARALRDIIAHDLPRAFRAVERDTEQAVLAEIHELATEKKAKQDAAQSDYFYTPAQHADNLILFVMEMGVNDRVRELHPALDMARFKLAQSDDPKVAALGYCLGLTALLETPGALEHAAQVLRDRLSEGVPLMWEDTLR